MKRAPTTRRRTRPAGIQYVGVPGSSTDCQDAIVHLLQSGARISHVRIVSSKHGRPRRHCLLLSVNYGDIVAVKSGFTSGYGGGGPNSFSYVLQALEAHGAEIEEYLVNRRFLERIDRSALTAEDLEVMDAAEPLRPTMWHDYVFEKHYEQRRSGTLWQQFPLVVPFAVIDSRIMDLTLHFWDNPDDKILKGYRRLEDIVRQRTGIDDRGSRLLSQAFEPKKGKLTWHSVTAGEHAGRLSLLTGAFLAYRNPRAHRESEGHGADVLMEFLLLNHLYRLEAEAVAVAESPAGKR